MKTITLGLILMGLAATALAIEPTQLDNRIRVLTGKFDEFQHRQDGGIPAEILRKAQGIMLLDRTKAGFLFAYQGGGGVALVKDAKLKKWSPVAFLNATEASLGFQIGGEQDFYVILFMTTNSTRMLVDQKVEFGAEARGTAGDSTAGVGTKEPSTEPPVLVYDERKGFYAGTTIKGGAIVPDDEANRVYYGDYLSMSDILFGHRMQPTPAATALAGKITWYSQKQQGAETANK